MAWETPSRAERGSARVDPTEGSVRSAVLRLSGPAVATALLQTVFNITDTFWVGRGLGPEALAGVSTAGFVVWMVLSLAGISGIGLTAVASRRHGEGSPEAAAGAGYEAALLAVVLSVVVALAGLAGLPGLFELMQTPPRVTAEGVGYLGVYLTGLPIVFLYYVMDAAFRAAGDTRTPFVLLAGAVSLNLVLDPLLILGVGPFPRLGIGGAALATLFTRGLACVAGYFLLVRQGLVRRVRPGTERIARMVRIGLPVSVAGAVFSLVYILLTRITSSFGVAALAALGVGHKVESISYMACVGFGVAASTSVGQNLGAEQPVRARRAGWLSSGLGMGVTAVTGAAFFLAPELIMQIFTDDPAVVAAGSSYLRIVSVAQMFMALDLILESAMSGAGYTLFPMLVGITLTVARLPMAEVLSGVLGLAGIWWAISSTTMARGAAMAWIWRRGAWKDREV